MKNHLYKHGYDSPLLFLILQENDISNRSHYTVPHYVQVLILEGRGHLIDEDSGERFELRPGSLIQRRPGKAVTQHFSSPGAQQIFFLSPPQVYDLIQASLGEQPACIQVEDVKKLYGQWLDFALMWREESYEKTVLALPPLLAAGLTSTQSEKDWIPSAQKWLIENTLSPEQIAAKLGMSYVSFRTRFRHETGVPPATFRRAHLMARADHLLQETDLSITDISNTLGCKDIYRFSRQFKHAYGLSPQQWRLHKKSRNENRNLETKRTTV